MTTFVNKGTGLFRDRGDRLVRQRSEARMKTYPSADDLRAWCDHVEYRRQHILELMARDRERCFGTLVPIHALIDIMLADKNSNISKLKKCLMQLWNFVEGCNLDNVDKSKLTELKKHLSNTCLKTAAHPDSSSKAQIESILSAEDGEEFRTMMDLHDEEFPEEAAPRGSAVPSLDEDIPPLRSMGERPTREPPMGDQPKVEQSMRTFRDVAKGPIRRTTKIKCSPCGKIPFGRITVKAQQRRAGKGDPNLQQPEHGQVLSDGENTSTDSGKKEDGNLRSAEDIQKLLDQLAARDILCGKQQKSIDNLRKERDGLNQRIQECLHELDGLKQLNDVSDSGVPTSCKEEMDALEEEMQGMRSGNYSPDEEADVIKKEVDVLRKYCLKLKAIEEENAGSNRSE
ncbi:hypothetical protein JTB14_018996 [Gonioctena quinquepunctata]|nr:hypothetical protein JTB14_018996 [Gonioctena quinquepunctata]